MKNKQFKIMLPDGLRAWLEKIARQRGVSLAEQIRLFLEEACVETTLPAPIRDLTRAVHDLAPLVHVQTGYFPWEAPEAFNIFREAVAARLARHAPDKPGKPKEPPPQPLISSKDPREVGIGLDGILFHRGGLIVNSRIAALGAAPLNPELHDKEGARRRRGKQMKHRGGNDAAQTHPAKGR